MTISTFYTDALKAHASMAQDFKIKKHMFWPKLSQYKTVNELSSRLKGCILAKSSKGSIAVRTIFDFKNQTVLTTFTIHCNVIFSVTYDDINPTHTMVLGSKEWLSQMTKRHLNHIFNSLEKAFKYVTVNNQPFILKDGSLYPLELNNSYLLSEL